MNRKILFDVIDGLVGKGYRVLLCLTHFPKGKGPDPDILPVPTEVSQAKIDLIRFNAIPITFIGGGKRHQRSSEVVEISTTSDVTRTNLLGSDASLEVIDGHMVIIFADGSMVPLEDYSGPSKEEVESFLYALPSRSFLVLGREILTRYYPAAESGKLYLLVMSPSVMDIIAVE